MNEPVHDPQEEFAEAQGHEYQNPHYHDEDPDIVDDESPIRHAGAAPAGKKKAKVPPPRPRYYED